MSKEYHVLYEGWLTDMPGRSESWTESVMYLGRNRWEYRIVGTDFGGLTSTEQTRERIGTRPLIVRLWDSDLLDEESRRGGAAITRPPDDQDEDPYDSEQEWQTLGPRLASLYEIANEVGAAYCIHCLDKWQTGEWLHPKLAQLQRKKPRLLVIKGVIKRGVWLGVYRPEYVVETSSGPGYLSPPDDTGHAILRLEGSSVHSGPSWLIRLTKAQLGSVAGFKNDFLRITEELSKRGGNS